MDHSTKRRIPRTISVAALALALVVAATAAQAQDRVGRWEFSLGTFYQLGTSVDGQLAGELDTDNDFGFTLGGGYNLSDRFAVDFGLQWAGVGYKATALDEEGDEVNISGKYDEFIMSGNLILHLAAGPLVPYIGAGIGWTPVRCTVTPVVANARPDVTVS